MFFKFSKLALLAAASVANAEKFLFVELGKFGIVVFNDVYFEEGFHRKVAHHGRKNIPIFK
jgi:hypothetical protein